MIAVHPATSSAAKLTPSQPAWIRPLLLCAAGYNLLWGVFVILAPAAMFRWSGLELPRYPELWQCIGMIVGLYGVGYAIAAFDVRRHWPIVLIGLLGKIFGPLGFANAVLQGALPLSFGWILLTNDLIWWIPFALILAYAWREAEANTTTRDQMLTVFRASNGQTLSEMSHHQPLMLIFLRHFGCTFCREALSDLKRDRARLEDQGIRLVVVHMMPPQVATQHLAKYTLDDIEQVSDPQRELYRSFQLKRGNLWQLFGPTVWWRGVSAWFNGHGLGKLEGDGFQMPGVFVVSRGRVKRTFLHPHAGARPNYLELATQKRQPRTEACHLDPREAPSTHSPI